MNNMRPIVVGGSPEKNFRASTIANIFAHCLDAELSNGFLPKTILPFDLIVWMPNFPNEHPKKYPVKKKGSVLICSKVMRDGYTKIDSVSRIFNMHGNAVIEIYKESKPILFQLRDALGNIWVEKTSSITKICHGILKLYEWTKGSIRKSLTETELPTNELLFFDNNMIDDFIVINNAIAQKCAAGCGNRYFGNYSTRCTKLFPSCRVPEIGEYFLFSPRNTDKRYVSSKDLVLVSSRGTYTGKKPSVDTPVLLELYKNFEWINFIIHGHAYINDAPITLEYFPCGDMREVAEVENLLRKGHSAINLLNHGFIIFGKNLEDFNQSFDFSPIN
jgi:hypothetical protein